MFNVPLLLSYGKKILHGIKFYGFAVGTITVKFNSVKHLYLIRHGSSGGFMGG